MNINKTIIAPCYLFVFLCAWSGCAHGPARHHTLGYYRYATFEFTKRSSFVVKPIALPAGLAVDVVLMVVDTAVTPIAAFIIPGEVIAVSSNEEATGLANLVIPTYPITLANIGAMGMGSGSREEYEAIFGHESSLFLDTAPDHPAVQSDSP